MNLWTVKVRIIPEQKGKISYTGHLLRALFLSMVSRKNPNLAKKLHSPRKHWGLAPYAIRSLKPASIKRSKLKYYPLELDVDESIEYEFEISIFDKYVYESVIELLPLTVGEVIRLSGIDFQITRIDIEKIRDIPNPRNVEKFSIIFQSPTYFRARDRPRHILLPLPELVVCSAYRIWLIFFQEKKLSNDAIKTMIDTLKQRIANTVIITKHRIETIRPIDIGQKRRVIGFVGTTTYLLENREIEETISILKIAEYTNIGGNRTGGFGAIQISFK